MGSFPIRCVERICMQSTIRALAAHGCFSQTWFSPSSCSKNNNRLHHPHQTTTPKNHTFFRSLRQLYPYSRCRHNKVALLRVKEQVPSQKKQGLKRQSNASAFSSTLHKSESECRRVGRVLVASRGGGSFIYLRNEQGPCETGRTQVLTRPSISNHRNSSRGS